MNFICRSIIIVGQQNEQKNYVPASNGGEQGPPLDGPCSVKLVMPSID